MFAQIRRLPAVVANQIAAGEVVERPAAIVKELLENSIDAGASHIRVDIEEGGVKLVRVRDDGHGIAPEELPLALARHATSKVASSDDLHQISTLGFRGEALPSIASVARMRVSSRVADREEGYLVEVAGAAEVGSPTPVAQPLGTTVEVRDLFFNTPARRRFLRATRTEYLHIEQVATRIALACPELILELWRDGKREILAKPLSADPMARIRALTGTAFAQYATPLEDDADGMSMHGWVLFGSHARAHNDVQYMSVNGRAVRDPMLRHAMRAAYGDSLSEGRQPAYVLYLAISPARVDVNVHPTKHELRFSDSRAVHDFVVSAVRRVVDVADRQALPLAMQSSLSELAPGPSVVAEQQQSPYHPLAGRLANMSAATGTRSSSPSGHAQGAAWDASSAQVVRRPGVWVRELAPGFVLTHDDDGHWLVNVAALARAAIVAALTPSASHRSAGGDWQARQAPLLIPYAWSASGRIVEGVDARARDLRRFGFELRATAPTELLLTAVPAVISGFSHPALVAAVTAAHASAGFDAALLDELCNTADSEAVHASPEVVEKWLRLVPDDARHIWILLDGSRLNRMFS
jgi:DNA mismatch repair protein MutL